MKAKWFVNLLVVLSMMAGFPVQPTDAHAGPPTAYQSTVQPLNWQRAYDLLQAAGDGAAFVLGNTLYHAGGWAGDSSLPISDVYAANLTDSDPGSWTRVTALPGTAR